MWTTLIWHSGLRNFDGGVYLTKQGGTWGKTDRMGRMVMMGDKVIVFIDTYEHMRQCVISKHCILNT